MSDQPPPPPPVSPPPPPPPPYQPPGGSAPPPPAFPPAPPGYSGYAPINPPTDGMAIASLVLGIIAFPSICCYGIPAIALGVTALILGRVSLRKIRAANGMIGGYGLAQAGWICGLVAGILGGLYGLFTLGVLLFGIFGGGGVFPFATPSG